MRIVVGISGATGVRYGVRLLEALRGLKVETDLILSDWATANLEIETDYTPEFVRNLATRSYSNDDLTAVVASGSTLTNGMVVIPCSMKTLAGIANGYSANLMQRAADVTIKEGRKLVLVVRETPLSPIHLENMLKLSRIGVTIMPPVPAFYGSPSSIDDLITQFIGRVLDQFGIEHQLLKRWEPEYQE